MVYCTTLQNRCRTATLRRFLLHHGEFACCCSLDLHEGINNHPTQTIADVAKLSLVLGYLRLLDDEGEQEEGGDEYIIPREEDYFRTHTHIYIYI